MRLSMDSEGKATVVTKDTSSPSPPRPYQAPNAGTAVAQAPALKPINLTGEPSLALAPFKRSVSGRSRDSRAWEFWCDKDARTALEDKAEKDGNGSAANAIGLLRSSSGRRILGSIPSKRNPVLSRQSTAVKRPKLDTCVPSLPRAKTSEGRLQQHKGHKKGRLSINIPDNESDKENRTPGTEVSRDDSVDDANDDVDNDAEIEAFMKGGRSNSNVSGEEEMDCVQGLLSLSQGAWR